MRVVIQNRDKRAVAILGIAVAAYVLVSWAVLPAYGRLTQAKAEAAEKEKLLEKYREVLGRKDKYSPLIADTNKQLQQAEDRIIRSSNPSLAAVELQTLVEGAARKFEISLSQRTVSSVNASSDPIRELTMTIAFDGSPRQLVSLLQEVRGAPKAIRVLTMHVNPVETAVAEPPKDRKFSKNVRVTMTLGAWIGNAGKGV